MLDKHIKRVERHGFDRDYFPMRLNGHKIFILKNDARLDPEDRLSFHFTLHCTKCESSESIDGLIPAELEEPSAIVPLKLAILGKFNASGCQK